MLSVKLSASFEKWEKEKSKGTQTQCGKENIERPRSKSFDNRYYPSNHKSNNRVM